MGLEGQPSPLRRIHLDLQDFSLLLEAEDGRMISYQPTQQLLQLLSLMGSQPAAPAAVETPAEETASPNPTVKLSGRLKSAPKEGRPDSSGFPTAWARFAAHDEGSTLARMYIATFHRKCRDIVLGLPVNSQLIVEGYPHQSDSPEKSDTLSVVHMINYPGKPNTLKDGN